MKSFLNYAKNRFLYNLMRILIIIGIGFLLGICHVKADTYTANEVTAQLYDNYGPNLSAVSTSFNGSYWTAYIPTMVANSAGAAWGISSPIPLLANHTYTVSINPGSYIGTSILSTYSRIGVGTTMDSAKTSYQNGGVYINYSKALGNGYIQYAFTPSSAGSFIVIPFSLNTSGDTVRFDLYDVIIEDLGSSGVTQDDINSSLSNQTNIIQNTINDMENNINNTINDNFNDCHDSSNLFDMNSLIVYDANVSYSKDSFTISSDKEWGHAVYNIYLPAGTYTIGGSMSGTYTQIGIVRDGTYIAGGSFPITFYSNGNNFSFTFYGTTSGNAPGSTTFSKIQLVNSSVLGNYEPFGKICKNKIDATNDKLDQAEETRKGIWETIKDLPNQFMNMLKGLFIPEDGYFEYWFNDLKSFFETKLGFLATPFTIFVEFIEKYLELDSSADIIINIPDITVPNFEDYVIVHATSFNWTETLKSKDSLNALWQLYLAFIDVYLILNFINFCETKYNRIFGGDTANYEYYTVEDSYTYDNNTGEVLSSRRNERKTTRKKVE